MSPSLRAAARDALGRGDMAAVKRFATALIEREPHEPEGPFLLGLAQAAAGQIGAAIRQLHCAIALAPRGEYRAQLARLLLLARRDTEAAAVLAAVETDLPADALSRDTIGCAYARLANHDAALPHFAEAVRLAPRQIDFRYNLAATLSFIGRTDEAATELETLIAIAPHHGRAYHLLSGLRKQTSADNHIPRLGAAAAQAKSGPDRLLLGYALAKELDDIGRAQDAFAALAAANGEHRRSLRYSFAQDAAVFDAIERHWSIGDRAPVAAPVDLPAPVFDIGPIFIIGMPRTGTTLVDRILSSHPDVESLGELQALPLAVKAAAGTRTRTVLDPDTVAAAAGADPALIGNDYLARAQPYRRTGKPRFTDKFPGNFHYAGLIARALPSATIVCLRRNPLDTVLSNFRNLFAVSSRYYDYSYDLLDIAAYYVRFDRLMAMWRRILPNRVLELEYEALVADQEGETRRLLAHCGLDWSARCLEFHTNAAAVSTPSAAQVRRPLNSDGIARWRAHAQALAPARRVIEAAGITID
jgi:tetratricopeptide (TPR) repeat protein